MGTAAAKASAWVMSAATTSKATRAAISQQQGPAPGAPQGSPAGTWLMLRGTTGELRGGPTPRAAAAQVAKVAACTEAASTLHSCSWAWTSSQAYPGAGAGAGTKIGGKVPAGVIVGTGVASGVVVITGDPGEACGVATGVAIGVAAGVATGVAGGA